MSDVAPSSRQAFRRARVLTEVVVPACLLVVATYAVVRGDAIDFDANLWQPANAVLAGHSPYPPPDLSELVKPFFLYPPLLLGLAIPLSVFPHDVARALFFAIEVAAVVASLRLVGVTDRRVLSWASLSYPVFDALLLGNPTLLLLPPIAVAWRWRERWFPAGVAVATAGALKLFVWPLGVWLLATRRLKAAVVAALGAVCLVVVPWALLEFDGLADYEKVARLYTQFNGGPRAINVAGLVHALGGSWYAGRVIQWVCGLTVIAAACRLAYTRRSDGDRKGFALALVAALILSPVVWIHYLALLLIPLAITRPSFDRAWGVLLALWIFPLLAHGAAHVVHVDGRVIASAGPVPTIPQLVVGLGFMAYVIVVTTGRWDGVAARRPAKPA